MGGRRRGASSGAAGSQRLAWRARTLGDCCASPETLAIFRLTQDARGSLCSGTVEPMQGWFQMAAMAKVPVRHLLQASWYRAVLPASVLKRSYHQRHNDRADEEVSTHTFAHRSQ